MLWLLWGLDKDCCFRVLISLEKDSLRELELGDFGCVSGCGRLLCV